MAERRGAPGLLPRAVTAAWGWRLELGVALAAGILWRLGAALGGPGGGLLAGGLVTLVLWRTPTAKTFLAQRLREASERRWLDRSMAACHLVGPWGGRPGIRTVLHVPAGLRVAVRVPLGQHPGNVERVAGSLAAALRVREVRVTRDLADASIAHLVVVRRDPLAVGPPLRWPWVGTSRTSAWDPVPLGVDEEGRLVTLRLAEHNLRSAANPGRASRRPCNWWWRPPPSTPRPG